MRFAGNGDSHQVETIGRLDILATQAGDGLWHAILHEGDPMHPKARYARTAEFRRRCGCTTQAAFPNAVQSWSDRLHPAAGLTRQSRPLLIGMASVVATMRAS